MRKRSTYPPGQTALASFQVSPVNGHFFNILTTGAGARTMGPLGDDFESGS